jgi:hypothetical protein
MPEWRRLVRDRLAGLALPPADEIGIVEELAQHLDDRYRELMAAGSAEPDAVAASLAEIADETFVNDLERAVTDD